jgi:hypothetical protein
MPFALQIPSQKLSSILLIILVTSTVTISKGNIGTYGYQVSFSSTHESKWHDSLRQLHDIDGQHQDIHPILRISMFTNFTWPIWVSVCYTCCGGRSLTLKHRTAENTKFYQGLPYVWSCTSLWWFTWSYQSITMHSASSLLCVLGRGGGTIRARGHCLTL